MRSKDKLTQQTAVILANKLFLISRIVAKLSKMNLVELVKNDKICKALSLEIFFDKEVNILIESKDRISFEKRMNQEYYKKSAVQCFPKIWPNAFYLVGSPTAAIQLGIDLQILRANADFLTGSKLWSGSVLYAENYGGHQYGIYKNLGEGRTVTIGYLQNYQIQLRGSVKTPYSVKKDGNIPVTANVYEFFLSEYLQQLNIPTARTLCVALSTTPCSSGTNKDILECCGITILDPFRHPRIFALSR
jgi:uncharacterized protein YdiU (UPF0061 family)